jgi:hypothetical protein
MNEFKDWAGQIQQRTESALNRFLPAAEIAPKKLHQAMRYSVMGGGKRVRALLSHAAGELCHAEPDKIDVAASAVELIHAYSLVHDDMPCMTMTCAEVSHPAINNMMTRLPYWSGMHYKVWLSSCYLSQAYASKQNVS